jgi:perosamine synthetase
MKGFIHQVEPYTTEGEAAALVQYLKSGGWLTEFRKTEEFEEMIADFTGARYAVVLTSGTAALYLCMVATGLGRGDRVMVPNYTMVATANAVKWAGAEPVLVDVEPSTMCMDIEEAGKAPPCDALLYVSINGRSGDMAEVAAFCKDRNMIFIEDACQSFGSRWSGRHLGTFGDMGVFSFTPHKLITTGQGGAVVTDDERLYRKVKKLKDFNRTAPATDWHDGLGFNFKFTDLQAVVGMEQMKTIDFRVSRKRETFRRYRERLGEAEKVYFFPTDLDNGTTPWFVDIVLPSHEAREGLREHLKQSGVGSRPFYPPINHQRLYSSVGRGRLPVSESLAYRGLWLPSSVGLREDKIDYACDKILEYFGALVG